MLVPFFYTLRQRGIPVSPTAFLRLQKALGLGLVLSLEDLYAVARALLVKSERDFDTYDQVFAELFSGAESLPDDSVAISDEVRLLLEEWLKVPEDLAKALGMTEKQMRTLSGEELIQYFLDRLNDQKKRHYGGSRWIGAGGVSPVGHSGYRPKGMRIGGASLRGSAIKTAMERRYKDYSQTAPLTASQMGEAIKRLRHLTPSGPRTQVNVDKTIYQTMRNAGEIEIVFEPRLKDKLSVLLLIDNGGWSMDPYVETVQTLFHYAETQFRDLSIFYYHNTVRGKVWHDPQRHKRPESVENLLRRDPQTRLIFVGDASMAPEELFDMKGSIDIAFLQTRPSIEWLQLLAGTFRHAAWLNPKNPSLWDYNETLTAIRKIFPMFPLNLLGLEKAVAHLGKKN
jgi:uncharacterized protein with von Willebrand factor type A (vWA) domain